MPRTKVKQIIQWIACAISIVGTTMLLAAAPTTVGNNPLYKPTAAPPATTTTPPRPATTSNTSTPGGGGSGDSAMSNQILTQIKVNTDNILKKLDQLPTMLTELLNITKAEDMQNQTSVIAASQANMDKLGQYFQFGSVRDPDSKDANNDNIDAFNNTLIELQKDAFANSQTAEGKLYDANSFKVAKDGAAPINQIYTDINSFSYPTIIGLPPLTDKTKVDPSWVSSYIKSASGATLFHRKPNVINPGSAFQKSYSAYFNLANAVQSFNNYVLGKYLLRGGEISQQQSVLYRKASNGAYLSSIASQPIGYVLRDILLFQSQQYVLTSKLVEIQREALMATVMTNALLIASNQQAEDSLYDQTQKVKIGL